jgi:DnaJ-class molecular chaperone
MNDPHNVLGVARDATLQEIKRAFRRLAKEFHPDRNGGDGAAAERLREVIAAYEILTDPEKRAAYERNASGPWKGAGWTGPESEVVFDPGFGRGDTMADLVGDIAGNRRGRGGTSMIIPGEDMAEDVRLSFVEAATGTVRRLALATHRTVDVTVPPGAADGEVITIYGFGFPGFGGAPPGNLNVTLVVEPDPVLRRDGLNVRMDIRVTEDQARRGARQVVPTVGGEIGIVIPAGARTGDELRLEGMGVRDRATGRRGDQLVRIVVEARSA